MAEYVLGDVAAVVLMFDIRVLKSMGCGLRVSDRQGKKAEY